MFSNITDLHWRDASGNPLFCPLVATKRPLGVKIAPGRTTDLDQSFFTLAQVLRNGRAGEEWSCVECMWRGVAHIVSPGPPCHTTPRGTLHILFYILALLAHLPWVWHSLSCSIHKYHHGYPFNRQSPLQPQARTQASASQESQPGHTCELGEVHLQCFFLYLWLLLSSTFPTRFHPQVSLSSLPSCQEPSSLAVTKVHCALM